MTETTQEERNTLRYYGERAESAQGVILAKAANDADRLAQYERDLHDDVGKDRSQDTDWLRAGFLQRGAEIERLEDGIRALAEHKEQCAEAALCCPDSRNQHKVRADEFRRQARELRRLLDD